MKTHPWPAYVLLAILSCLSGLLSAQTETVEALRAELTTVRSDTARLRIHLALSKEFQVMLPEEFMAYADTAIALAQKVGDADKEMQARYQLAVGYYIGGDAAKTCEIMAAIEASGVFADNPEALINVYNLKGGCLGELARYEESLDAYYHSLRLSKDRNDSRGEMTALGNLGKVYAYHLDYEKGKDLFLQALAIAETEQDSATMAILYNNLSTTSPYPDSAILFARQALAIFSRIGYADGVAYASDNLGANLAETKKYEEALLHLKTAQNIWQKTEFNGGLTSVYTNLSIVFGYLGQKDSLDYYLDRLIVVSDPETGLISLMKAYESIADYQAANGQPAAALDYYHQAVLLKDSLFTQQRAEQLAIAETRFETQTKEKQLIENDLLIIRQRSQQKNILIGGIVLVLALLGLFQYLRTRQRLRQKDAELALQLEKADADKLREMDRIKSNFFANISHEFRTPLTLIQTPLRQAISQAAGDTVVIPLRYARTMSRNSQRLLHLVNQLLDLAKLENGGLQLQVSQGDLAHFVRSIGYGFESMALRKQMNYHVTVSSSNLMGWYDADKLELILSNLLTNAFKFTPPEGRVLLEATFTDEKMQLIVRDNGIGIPATQLVYVFDRFYSTNQSAEEMIGSGIGMALTRELVTLYHGTIRVESEVSRGTSFFVELPYTPSAFASKELAHASQPAVSARLSSRHTWVAAGSEYSDFTPPVVLPDDTTKPVVLVVEDNADLRQYTREQLETDYQILEAINGKEGLEFAIKHIPDLVITDILMPEMNGYELCNQLRQDEKTSHIPVIMLTAKAERAEKLAGLSTGADDYLTKPFDTLELSIRVRNLIEQRRLLRERFAGEIVFKPHEIATTSIDEQFLTRLLEATENNMEEETFSVAELAHIMTLSRSQLHRKLKAITGKSPNQLIRDMRLQRARDLLEKQAGNASEIAFAVGFSSLAYFSKCFKDRFGISPSEVTPVS